MAAAHHSGLLQRGGADVDPAAAGGQRGRQRLVVADAAGQLDLDVERADDLGQQLAVVPAAEGGVEVDQVDPLRARLLPAQRGLDRVAEALLRAGHALHQLDGLAAGDVDGGQAARGGTSGASQSWSTRLSTQLRSSAAPASPDFSGWNWVAHSGPFSTAATNRSPPCSAQVTSGDAGAVVGDQGPGAHGVGVHEVEPLVLDAGEQRASRRARRRCSSPCAGTTRRLQPLDHARPLAAALGLDAVLDARARTAPACRRRCRAPGGRRRAGARSARGRRPRAARPCRRRTRPRRAPPGRRRSRGRRGRRSGRPRRRRARAARTAERRLPDP